MRLTVSFLVSTLLSICLLGCISAGTVVAAEKSSVVEGFTSLIIDGTNCGLLHSVSGGASCVEVVDNMNSTGHFPQRYPRGSYCEPISLQIGIDIPKALRAWLADACNAVDTRKNGSVLYCDRTSRAVSELQFTKALVTEVSLPACDKRSNEPGYLSISIEPLSTLLTPASPNSPPAPARTGEWRSCNFALEIEGIDCSKVLSIEPITVKRQGGDLSNAVGGQAPTPITIVCSNLSVVLANSSVPAWKEWIARCAANKQPSKNGSLVFFDSAHKEITRIKLYGLIPCKLGPAPNADGVGLAVAEISCDRAVFGAESTTGPASGTMGGGASSTTTRPIGR